MTLESAAAERLDDGTSLVLTNDAQRELREAGTTLTAEQLRVLVLMDEQCTVGELARRARPSAQSELLENLQALIDRKLVRVVSGPGGNFIDPGDFFKKAEAPADVGFLRRNGYFVNLARRGASRTRPKERNLTVLVIDDDPDIGALLRKYLKLEGLDTRIVADRAEIEADFRRGPLPDAVLLDIGLNELDGFLVLERMREHSVLKDVPVIILTATANREVVLKGILAGADGHITKPFQIHPLVRAVKAVLGIDYDPAEQDWDRSL